MAPFFLVIPSLELLLDLCLDGDSLGTEVPFHVAGVIV